MKHLALVFLIANLYCAPAFGFYWGLVGNKVLTNKLVFDTFSEGGYAITKMDIWHGDLFYAFKAYLFGGVTLTKGTQQGTKSTIYFSDTNQIVKVTGGHVSTQNSYLSQIKFQMSNGTLLGPFGSTPIEEDFEYQAMDGYYFGSFIGSLYQNQTDSSTQLVNFGVYLYGFEEEKRNALIAKYTDFKNRRSVARAE